MNQVIWNEWVTQFEWIMKVSKQRGWDVFKWKPLEDKKLQKGWDIDNLEIIDPVTSDEIEKLEAKTEQVYPTDFKTVLSEYASAVRLNWHMNDEEIDGYDVFCGAGYGYLWDFGELEEVYEDYRGWLANCWTDPNDDYGGVYYNKVPFISVPNGDLIVFDKHLKDGLAPVIYLSHDDGDLHGCKLASNFIEFISRWAAIGCVGTEGEQFASFYDFDRQEIFAESPVIDAWRVILNQTNN